MRLKMPHSLKDAKSLPDGPPLVEEGARPVRKNSPADQVNTLRKASFSLRSW